ncbi:Alpha/beta knot methyltransferase [Aspergillus granulosus]|uniref:rRNA methyltransferase 1, mitochondrial n=1 Tax=Aspergillus granulosus TaxID=176169 RepID=A0ABR4I3P9_9EURO
MTFKPSLRALALPLPRSFIRCASLNSAIDRGIRRSQRLDSPRGLSNDRRGRTPTRRAAGSPNGRSRRYQEVKGSRGWPSDDHDSSEAGRQRFASPIGPDRRSFTPREYTKGRDHRNRDPEVEFDEDEFIRTGNFRALPREHQRFTSTQRPPYSRDPSAMNKSRSAPKHDSARDSQRQRRLGHAEAITTHKPTDQKPERIKEHVKAPDTIPYTTPASEFIYGTAAVEAALRCGRRQLYKLYIYQAADEELSVAKMTLRKLAFSKNVKVKMAFAEWDRLLDKMSAGRPHNGCVLEASPLPRTPIQALKTVNPEENNFQLELAPQTREEALVNGMNNQIPINPSFTQQQRRQPVVLMLDGIVDPGNLGAIIRSAYYLGVDAVVFAGRNSAPLSPVTIKSSAGAAESMTLLDVKNEVDFIQRSKANGWRFYAADAPNAGSTYIDQASNNHDDLIGHSPSVIMMGNEGSGLSNHIRTQADSIVSIPGARLIPGVGVASDPARVDSLNVSVASALLMEKFLRVPLGVSAVPRKENSRQ